MLRDITAGWMTLLDTQRKSGLAILSNYKELDCLFACGGNETLEPMYRVTGLPAGQSLEYVTYVVPVVGLDNVVSATPDYIAGYHMKTDGKGAGAIALSVIRSVHARQRAFHENQPGQYATIGADNTGGNHFLRWRSANWSKRKNGRSRMSAAPHSW